MPVAISFVTTSGSSQSPWLTDCHYVQAAPSCNTTKSGAETIANQGSRALIIQQTCRGSFSAASLKQIFESVLIILQRFAHFCAAPNATFADCWDGEPKGRNVRGEDETSAQRIAPPRAPCPPWSRTRRGATRTGAPQRPITR